MSLNIASRLRRPLVALLCVQIVVGPAGTIAAGIPGQEQRRLQNQPNFQPPSATNCARPVQTTEISATRYGQRVEPPRPAESLDRSSFFVGNTISDLRDLDPAFGTRTLTLIDGRRVVSTSSATDVVDLNIIPPNLLERMDVVTGGASATYGSGAMAGVVAGGDRSELSEVMVTGTRMESPAMAAASPITSITGEEMRRLGVVNAADALLQLVPQNISSYSPTVVTGSAGANMRPPAVPVTAGMVDDNADFNEYLRFRYRTQVPHREVDISMRYLLQVRDPRGVVVPDAEVIVQAPTGAAMWARTDAGGRVWLHPLAFDSSNSQMYEVTVRKNGYQGTAFLQRGQKSAVDVVIRNSGPRPARARLDLVFLVDATGSMDDEIAKLKSTLHTIADEVAALPSHPDTCFGLVAYRDANDEFLVRRHDFTNDLGGFQGVLDALRADGGGDYPEAMNEALADTVHHMSWRGTDTTRLVVLLADAPPHLDYNAPQYDASMIAALGKGIKVLSVGASGLDKQGEYIQRQIAQYTGGRFVFLTYRDAANPASGPGRETVHDVNDYSVQTLDRLIVRLVSEELQKLPQGR